MTEAPSPIGAIYARISQDRAGAGLGVDRQVADCRTLGERLGWPIVAVHSDNDVSAYSGKPRPGYRALLEDVAAGRVNRVLVWHTDRLHRSPVELEEWIAVCEPRNVETHSVRAGHLDLATPSGRMVARQLGAVARFESEHKGDRVRAARQQAATEGRWQGGARPFGFEADGTTIRPGEAAEIVAATDLLLAGAGLRVVARDWNSRGFRTTHKAQYWSSQTVKDVLVRPRNAGLAVYRGEVVGPAAWPAIVPEDRWRALVRHLTDPGRRTSPQDVSVKWLGSGLYVCGTCGGAKLRASTSGQRAASYRCGSRDSLPRTEPHVTRKAAPLDDFVERVIVERLSRPDAAELLRRVPEAVDTEPMHTEAVELGQRLEQLAEAFSDGAITVTQLRTATERLQSRLTVVRSEIAAAANTDPLVGLAGEADVGEQWAVMDIRRKRAVLAELMTVTIMPASRRRPVKGERFDRESIAIAWHA